MIVDWVIEGEPRRVRRSRQSTCREPSSTARYRRALVRLTFEIGPDTSPWGGRQPKFEHLATEGPDRYFLTGRDATGGQIRVQLGPGHFEAEPAD
jgi:hypothetical protein